MSLWLNSKRRRLGFQCLLIALCVLLDLGLRSFCFRMMLPFWLDSVGIMLATYILGMSGGIITACGTSLTAALLFSPAEGFYVIPAVLVAVITGVFIRRPSFSSLGDALGLTLSLVLAAVLVSVPINFAFFGGRTGVTWGDAVIFYLEEHEVDDFRFFIGQLYVEFLDKALAVLLFYLLIHYFLFFHRLQRVFSRRSDEASPELFSRLRRRGKKTAASSLMLWGLGVLTVLWTWDHECQAAAYNINLAQLQENEAFDLDVISRQQTVYDSNRGLSCGEANDIASTPDGALWVATYAGLFRYNGKEFTIEPNFKAIRSVITLYTGKDGRLWVGTNGQGVLLCDRDTIISAITTSEGLPADNIRGICADRDELFYINTVAGLVTLYAQNRYVVHKTDLGDAQVVSLACAPNDLVGAVSNEGVLYVLHKGRLVQALPPVSKKSRYTAVGFGSDNRLYATTADGRLQVFSLSGQQYSFEKEYLNERISEVKTIRNIVTDNGEMLFICADSGIFFLKDAMLESLLVENFSNSIESCILDYQGNLWFTSSRLGLLKLAHTPVTNIFQTARLAPVVVNCVEKWDGLLYVGTDEGLTIIEPNSGQAVLNKFIQLLDKLRIRQLYTDSQGYLWVCTYGRGVFRLSQDGSYRQYTAQDGLFGDKVRTVFEYSPQELLVAGAGGYSVFDRRGQLSNPNEDLDKLPAILAMQRDSEGNLLVGTNGHGIALVKNHRVDRFITQRDGLVSDVVMRIVPSSTPDLFYVVTGNGLCLLDPELKVRSLDNFPYYDNFDVILAQDGLLFVTGSSGIYVISEKALLQGSHPLSYVRLDNKSGFNGTLTANAWNYQDEQHNLYLGGNTGVFKVNTYRYYSDNKPYKLSLRGMSIDQESFNVGSGLPVQIARKARKLTFFPEIINFSSENPLVGHYLEGLEQHYTYTHFSDLYDITYTNLPPGNYRLHLAVFKEDGTRVSESVFAFEKMSAFYDTRLFFIYLYTVAGLMIAYVTFFIVIIWTRHKQEADRLLLEITQQQLRMGDETILTIAQALDARDQRTQQHSKRVSQYSVMIARELGLNEAECENLRKVALLHDIGKIGIPDRILNKPGKLTDEEYAVMKSHVVIGSEILKNFSSFSNVADGVRYHHERYDGRGYAQGLKGEEIPLYGRIIAVADTFDAMTANRVYRKKLSIDVVLSELEKGRGTQFDPQFAEIMIRLIKEGKVNLDELYAEETAAGEPENSTDQTGTTEKRAESAQSETAEKAVLS